MSAHIYIYIYFALRLGWMTAISYYKVLGLTYALLGISRMQVRHERAPFFFLRSNKKYNRYLNLYKKVKRPCE